ncbi:Doublecortin domain-containing protein 1 [Myotis brandtii]|uniref:Doublecortin domain-containing protein 1 n=1 Tax=Myotis brandtii TaxID=109478 RepID=S7PM91_MYOBR|nr:Doublecortin domain-containing protein 1 [Myotis brandtii]
MAKIETEDHRTALSQSSSSSLTKAMKESQQSNSEGTFNGDSFHSVDKYSSNYLPREFMTSQAKAVIKTTKDYLQPQFGPNRLLLSAAISERSGLQNCSTHQTVSDHRHGEISYPDSYKSNRNNNSCFISASKRNRPVSAPEGQPRVVEFSSLKFQSAHNWHRISQRHKLQPRVIRVTAYKNGSRTVFAKVAVPTISLLLEECTEKLHLNMAARRVFLADGSEALEPEDIPHEADVYVSMGEPFLDPFKKIKDHLLLMKKVTWTMNGLMFPTKVKRRKTKPVLSTRMKKLTGKTSVRILFFKNGMGQDGHEVIVGKETMKKVSRLIDELQTAIKSNRDHLSKLGPQLQAEQEQFSSYVYQHIKSLPAKTLIPRGLQLKLLLRIHQRLQGSSINPPGLNFSSTRLFDEHGQEIKNPLLLKNEQKIWVSYGKAYRSPWNPVLSLTFDQVTAFARGGITIAYKTFLDPKAVLLPGCDNWEVCEGFPVNFNANSQQIPDQFEKVDLEDHFLQNKAYPQFVLTYLEELKAQMDVTQTEYHIHHGTWTTAHQEHGSSLAGEVLQESASIPGLQQLSEPSDTHLMPEGSLGETGQLTVALVRRLEEKHPKASAQR